MIFSEIRNNSPVGTMVKFKGDTTIYYRFDGEKWKTWDIETLDPMELIAYYADNTHDHVHTMECQYWDEIKRRPRPDGWSPHNPINHTKVVNDLRQFVELEFNARQQGYTHNDADFWIGKLLDILENKYEHGRGY